MVWKARYEDAKRQRLESGISWKAAKKEEPEGGSQGSEEAGYGASWSSGRRWSYDSRWNPKPLPTPPSMSKRPLPR